MLTYAEIREVLLKADHPARTYFRNILGSCTGVDPTEAYDLDLKTSTHFLKYVCGMCVGWGNQRIDYIGRCVKELNDFLIKFKSEVDMHDLHTFTQKLDEYAGYKHILSEATDEIVRATELLQKFHSVGFKTAVLVMRFLCLDCNFFRVDKSRLIPPLDRVNYRMCRQVLGEQYTKEKLGTEKEQGSFSKDKIIAFGNLGAEILKEEKILIDNFWFIGHFYHDGQECSLREGAKIIDFQYLKNVDLPEECPFSECNCERISTE